MKKSIISNASYFANFLHIFYNYETINFILFRTNIYKSTKAGNILKIGENFTYTLLEMSVKLQNELFI